MKRTLNGGIAGREGYVYSNVDVIESFTKVEDLN